MDDPVVEHLLRSLPAHREAGDLYAESAAAFLAGPRRYVAPVVTDRRR
ncbi:hypothetical protein OG978_43465 (plasmid) [Streptomyces sp. NBC_01591]|nr:hypothetical protein [Streptomyces sp. NBC_01591]WSD74023.1 hypothetical protein OG978_43465 [Streptomyces sp. NBC_01591]